MDPMDLPIPIPAKPDVMVLSKRIVIDKIYRIVGSSYIKGFWIFDPTTGLTVPDRGPLGHNLTLGSDASLLSPGVAGYCPNLTMAGTAATSWSVADSNDFSFGNGAGVDSAFTLVALVNPNADDFTLNRIIVGKGAAAAYEYWIQFYGNGFGAVCINNAGTAYVGRSTAAIYALDAGSWHTYAVTFSGGSPQANAGCNLYRDGVDVDSADYTVVGYAGMTGGTASLESYVGGLQYSKAKYGVVIIISKELTSTEVGEVNTLLQSYVGTGIPPMDLLLLEDDV